MMSPESGTPPVNGRTAAPPIQDRRPKPKGVLPRQIQMWLMAGIALVILTIIFFTGRASPAPRAAAPDRAAEPPLAREPPAGTAASVSAKDDRDRETPREEHPASGPRQRLLEGTVIEAVLTNRIDGALAGPVNGLVTNPVYSLDRQVVLIPAGA